MVKHFNISRWRCKNNNHCNILTFLPKGISDGARWAFSPAPITKAPLLGKAASAPREVWRGAGPFEWVCLKHGGAVLEDSLTSRGLGGLYWLKPACWIGHRNKLKTRVNLRQDNWLQSVSSWARALRNSPVPKHGLIWVAVNNQWLRLLSFKGLFCFVKCFHMNPDLLQPLVLSVGI